MLALSEIMAMMEKTSALNYDEYLQRGVDDYNSTEGDLTGFDCRKCKNRGYFWKVVMAQDLGQSYQVSYECECMNIRRNMDRISKSGLSEMMTNYTFEKYQTTDSWQQLIVKKAKEFLESEDAWFFIGGQVGCGKTHICTAIVSNFMNSQRKSAKYMLWRDDITQLKANVMNDSEYKKIIEVYKRVDVLYIDDFFKTEEGKNPTQADINIAFEIINARYNSKKKTLISCEKSINEILDIDEAVGSRVFQMTREYCLNIGKDRSKNMRLK